MTPAPEKLEKILQLEQEQDYRDKAVIGGLACFADAWCEQAQREAYEKAWVEEIAERLRAYSQLSTQTERQESLRALRAALDSVDTREPPLKPGQPSVPVLEPDGSPVQADRPQPKQAPRKPSRDVGEVGLDSPTTVISGIGPTQSKRWARLGVRTIRAMLLFFPLRYDDFSSPCASC